MSSESLPSVRPEDGAGVKSHIDPRTAQRSSIKLTLEPATEPGYRAAWSFFHREHKTEIDLLASNLEELRLLRAAVSQERKAEISILASLLEEVRQLREMVQASNTLTVRST